MGAGGSGNDFAFGGHELIALLVAHGIELSAGFGVGGIATGTACAWNGRIATARGSAFDQVVEAGVFGFDGGDFVGEGFGFGGDEVFEGFLHCGIFEVDDDVFLFGLEAFQSGGDLVFGSAIGDAGDAEEGGEFDEVFHGDARWRSWR